MEVARILKLLSNKTRLRILRLLRDGEKSVTHLVESLRLSQPTISHHLKRLEEAELVVRRKYKKWVYYSANVNFLRKFIHEFGLELDL